MNAARLGRTSDHLWSILAIPVIWFGHPVFTPVSTTDVGQHDQGPGMIPAAVDQQGRRRFLGVGLPALALFLYLVHWGGAVFEHALAWPGALVGPEHALERPGKQTAGVGPRKPRVLGAGTGAWGENLTLIYPSPVRPTIENTMHRRCLPLPCCLRATSFHPLSACPPCPPVRLRIHVAVLLPQPLPTDAPIMCPGSSRCRRPRPAPRATHRGRASSP